MNTHTPRRRIFAATGAALATLTLAVVSATASLAAPPQPVPTTSNVVITKLSQPDALQGPATGEALGSLPAGAVAIPGVSFEAKLVVGTGNGGANDIGTIAGQAYAAGLTVGTADVTGATAIPLGPTNGSGVINWNNVPRGVYLISETVTPAGVTAAGDFLLTVPLTNPTNNNEWLDTIYVYPKNAQVGATKTVSDASSLLVGSDVVWTISADIPRNPNPAAPPAFVAPDAFRIVDTLQNDELELVGSPVVTAGATTLTLTTHYTVTPDTTDPDETGYTIEFTPAGRAALATAVNADPAAKVTVALTTTVKKADVIGNSAQVFPNQAAITENTPITTATVESKYGSYQIVKKSTDGAIVDLSGAVFKVYPTEADALAGTNALAPTDNLGVVHDEWTTDEDGLVVIQGLRWTAFANGAVVTDSDPEYQTYWLVEITALPGHQLLTEPVEFVVDGSSVTQTAQEIVNQKTAGGFVLPLTGGMGTTVLTMSGLVLLALVMLVVVRRRRQEAAE